MRRLRLAVLSGTPCSRQLSRSRTRETCGLFLRRSGNDHGLDTATVRSHKLRGKCLVDRHVHRRPLNRAHYRRVACSIEVLGIGQLEVDVPLGGHTRAVTGGVIGDAVGGLGFVGNAALRAGDCLVGGGQIIAKRCPGGETRPPRNRRTMVYAHLRLPEAGFDRKIRELRNQAQRPKQENGCSAQTDEVRVFHGLHENPPGFHGWFNLRRIARRWNCALPARAAGESR